MNNVGVSRVKLAKRDLAIKSKRNQQLVARPMVYACHISNPVLVYTSKWNTNHTKKAKKIIDISPSTVYIRLGQ